MYGDELMIFNMGDVDFVVVCAFFVLNVSILCGGQLFLDDRVEQICETFIYAEALQLVLSECKPKAKIVDICEKSDSFIREYVLSLYEDV